MGKYTNRLSLEGKSSIVTGGTGILGSECVRALADAGSDVAIVDLDIYDVEQLADSISSEFGVKAIGYSCDIANSDQIFELNKKIHSDFGKVDILHNNAATKGSNLKNFFEPLESFSLELWNQVLDVNLTSMFQLARVFGAQMAERGYGTIIQTASIYGSTMGPDQRIYEGSEYMGMPINTPAVYSASKAGVHGLTLFLSTYWGERGVRVNTLTPGGISSGQNDVFNEKYSARVPLGRMAQVEEIASALLFLASDSSSYITGQNLHVDGGLSAW